jgi:signal transduction histidine kinase
MTTVMPGVQTSTMAVTAEPARAGAVPAVVGALLGMAGAVLAVIGGSSIGSGDAWLVAAAIGAWAAGAVLLAVRRPAWPLAGAVGLVALFAGGALALTDRAAASAGAGDGRGFALTATLAAVFHLAVGLPDGHLTRRRLALVVGGYVAAAGTGFAVAADAPAVPAAPLVVLGIAFGSVAAVVLGRSCRRATARDRARLQWAGWAALVTAAVGLAAWALSGLTGWPEHVPVVVVVMSVSAPFALVASTVERALGVVGRVLVHTIIATGMLILVTGVYVLVVVGFRGLPEGEERAVLALSMVAAAIIGIFSLPVRRRLEGFANLRVYGEREAPEEALRTFANRMSRAVPMDELLLQLAETLRKTMTLSSAEVWTGSDGVYELAVSVPDRSAPRLNLGPDERGVAARAHVSGNAWLAVWVPALLAGRDGAPVRVAPIAHLGDLLGFIVAERRASDTDFDEEEDRVLGDLARQLGLALHNVRLDTALQASLDELQVRNAELVASRARIVAAGDESRRRIERNLHDGAQQHLVAMAVKLGLARQLLDADATTAATMLEELREDAQVTLTELRELAHGIYPPLLQTRGLPEALQAAANRAVLPTSVEAAELPRFDPDVEAAVYFCCLEAIQNAGKHAGTEARLTVTIGHADGVLTFAVHDDGAGFEPAAVAAGHGFVNMEDRLGAFEGTLTVTSAPGEGTTVAGRVPAEPLAAG